MTIASIAELVHQERNAGASDDEIARLLLESRVPLPEGNYYKWTRIAVRAVVGEDEAGGPLP